MAVVDDYPDIGAIEVGLLHAKHHPTWTCDDFIEEAMKVCEGPGDSTMDMQRLAVLRFIERVLNTVSGVFPCRQ